MRLTKQQLLANARFILLNTKKVGATVTVSDLMGSQIGAEDLERVTKERLTRQLAEGIRPFLDLGNSVYETEQDEENYETRHIGTTILLTVKEHQDLMEVLERLEEGSYD